MHSLHAILRHEAHFKNNFHIMYLNTGLYLASYSFLTTLCNLITTPLFCNNTNHIFLHTQSYDCNCCWAYNNIWNNLVVCWFFRKNPSIFKPPFKQSIYSHHITSPVLNTLSSQVLQCKLGFVCFCSTYTPCKKNYSIYRGSIYPCTDYFLCSNLTPFLQTPVPTFSLKPQIV